ncbi:MAG: hypothetical protein F6K44_27915, partial [Moorea sp. SIO3E2]|nr:hypothetical protein [Moorena sp. SIO3E2]
TAPHTPTSFGACACVGAKTDERDTALGMITFGDLDTTGVTLIADKGYRRASFETELADAGITLDPTSAQE